MKLSVRKEFSVGLYQSDLGGAETPKFGTGVTLWLELEAVSRAETFEQDLAFWQQRLNQIVRSLDHVHLEKDHPELRAQKISESSLLNWIVEKVMNENLSQVTLGTLQNYSRRWVNSVLRTIPNRI